ncbi:MAG TPA: hydantoinase/oxoprolinase N-terminal domain-containing protein, partial [Stellaceae bacterium]|nr:hydantoinase/oxoprolinase N-terminal domain-containing protein [Stellaceae bacterium]
MTFVAVDIGGTFTDLIAFDAGAGQIHHAKTLTTPRDPVDGVIESVRKAGLDARHLETLIHG